MSSTTTYSKLKSGQWGIRALGSVTVGQTVTVTKKSGERKQETITAIVWQGDGITLCAIASAREPTDADGNTATIGRHWSSRGHGPMERLCSGGCGRRVSARYASCYSCHREDLEAM